MAGPRRCFVRNGLLAVASLLIPTVACGDASAPNSAPQSEPVPRAEASGSDKTEFAFAPTVQQHAPDGLEFEILLEVGNADEASLDVVVASAASGRTPKVRIELWTFDQRDKTKLEPKADPAWLLPLQAGQTPDAEAQLPRLKRALALPNSVKTRPMGLATDSPGEALQAIAAAAKTATEPAGELRDRLAALVTVFRGVSDEVFFDRTALLRLLQLATEGTLSSAAFDSSSPRRAGTSVDGTKLELLKSSGGWAVTAVR